MKTQDFLTKLADLLEIEDDLEPDTNLKDYDEYDSMAIMTLIAFIHKNFDIQLTARKLNQISTVRSMMELIGTDRFE